MCLQTHHQIITELELWFRFPAPDLMLLQHQKEIVAETAFRKVHLDPRYSEKICTNEIQPERYENRCPFTAQMEISKGIFHEK